MRRLLLALGIGLGVLSSPAYASVAESPGPALETPAGILAASLTCSPDLDGAARPPVMLVAGTGGTPDENYSWNYEPALSALRIPWCGVTVPDHTLADDQVQAEYLVHAIRDMHRRSGRRVAIVGYSQGGMTPRWPLRWWPDVRRLVDDEIGLAADNHGTAFAEQAKVCASECPPAAWQNLPGSEFLAALNWPAETFAGISYTEIFTNDDELSTPAGPNGTSPLHTGDGTIANVALQDVCPGHLADHMAIGSTDAVAFALVLDALDHAGPADPRRVDPAVCGQSAMPGARIDQSGRAIGAAPFLLAAATPFNVAGVDKTQAPPALREYTERPQVTAQLSRRGFLRLDVLAGTYAVSGLRLRLGHGRAKAFTARPPHGRWTIRTRVAARRGPLRLRIRDDRGRLTGLTLRFSGR